jgi:ABC transporter substrate binding protein (PQQ-dependent alcohol dehydrogenase system)
MNGVGQKFLCGLVCLVAVASIQAAPAKKRSAVKTEVAKEAAIKRDELPIAYLSQEQANPQIQPFHLPTITDRGVQGARLGIADNNTTGRFTQQGYRLKEVILPSDADAAAAFRQLLAEGYRHIVVNLPAETVAALAKLPDTGDVLIYNVGSSDDRLRGESCSSKVLHLLPSRAMRADALAQYLAKKRWQKLFLVTGSTEQDGLYAASIKRAAQRFGLKISAEKPWQHTFDERRTPESEIPVFTQGVEYDVLVVADETGSFGDYLSYRTWLPRPVAGTQGLMPMAWHYTHEQWGAIQLQNRFREQAGRWMSEEDYAAWLAVRAIGEAATRSKSVEFGKVKAFLLGDEFALAGFKGVPLSFRRWDGQLRQPVLLAADHSLVAVAPIEGFLHPKSELDTLGYDQPETPCHMNQ